MCGFVPFIRFLYEISRKIRKEDSGSWKNIRSFLCSINNITKQCSETAYYQYESTDADGTRHTVLISGSSEHVGWAEFVLLPDSTSFSNATYDGTEELEWLTSGKAAAKADMKKF